MLVVRNAQGSAMMINPYETPQADLPQILESQPSRPRFTITVVEVLIVIGIVGPLISLYFQPCCMPVGRQSKWTQPLPTVSAMPLEKPGRPDGFSGNLTPDQP
jgi:hypothetical protein